LLLILARSCLALKNQTQNAPADRSTAFATDRSKKLKSLLVKTSSIDLKRKKWPVLIRPLVAGFDSTPDIIFEIKKRALV
jgi:hypothetical protein